MKKIFLFILIGTFFICLPALQAEDSGAYGQLDEVADNSAAFDGGEGSASNTGTYDTSSVPDVGASGPVGYYDENMDYHSN